METIIRMVEADIERPNHGPEAGVGAIAGDPVEQTHEYYSSPGRSSGVWECTTGTLLDDPHEEDEFCTVISGRVGIVDNASGHEEIFTPGDSFFLPSGSRLTWNIYETLRKFYVTAE